MWLLPALAPVASIAARIFYRLQIDGPPVPRRGPALLVANHPNSLLDPVLVLAAARRPVRFLAKSTLFADRRLGWLIRASGAIPVYRRIDDADAAAANLETFRAVFAELSAGAAVGVFPEGITHDRPSLSRLKTGSARIALGAVAGGRKMVPIIPVGLVLPRKHEFRSPALAVLGPPVQWAELAGRGVEDREAVRQLTDRIDRALRGVTVNLERWEDRPLVEIAEAVWAAETGAPDRPADRLARLETTTAILAAVRRRGGERWRDLQRELDRFRRRLRVLRLSASELGTDASAGAALRWAALRLYLVGPPALLAAVAGLVLFWPPYRLTGFVVEAAAPPTEERSTWKLLLGIVLYGLWIALGALAAWRLAGPLAAAAAVVSLPAIGLVGLQVRERWREAASDARRFLLVRAGRRGIDRLRLERRRLAAELGDLHRAWLRGELEDPKTP